jgi:hypothetical protein
LDKALVRCAPHFAAQRVNLTDKVAFGGSSNGGIARAVSNGVHINRKNGGQAPKARRRQCSFDSGVAGTNNRYVQISGIVFQTSFPFSNHTDLISILNFILLSFFLHYTAGTAFCTVQDFQPSARIWWKHSA